LSHLQRFRSEVEAMKALEHRHVIELYDAIETIDTLAIVMQFAKNGDLLQYITKRKRLPEEEVRRIFRQICSGVEAAHKAGWIHRDLKVENIYLDENGSVRIGDWGFAGRWSPGVVRFWRSTVDTSNASQFQNASFGSLHYASPEIVQGTEYVGPEVDVWSLGVVLYALSTGTLPFGGADEVRTFWDVRLSADMSVVDCGKEHHKRDLLPAARSQLQPRGPPYGYIDAEPCTARNSVGHQISQFPYLAPAAHHHEDRFFSCRCAGYCRERRLFYGSVFVSFCCLVVNCSFWRVC
jgi:serine/threonine protein kinase